MLEVLQFGRDAYVAESWLAGQEPLVRAADLGANVDEVESLIKRHEAFEKLATAWEERFFLLEKLTTVSLFESLHGPVRKNHEVNAGLQGQACNTFWIWEKKQWHQVGSFQIAASLALHVLILQVNYSGLHILT